MEPLTGDSIGIGLLVTFAPLIVLIVIYLAVMIGFAVWRNGLTDEAKAALDAGMIRSRWSHVASSLILGLVIGGSAILIIWFGLPIALWSWSSLVLGLAWLIFFAAIVARARRATNNLPAETVKSIIAQSRQMTLWRWLVVVGAIILIGTIGADPRLAHIWWSLAALILIGMLGKKSGRKWGSGLLKVSFLVMALLAAGETGYGLGSYIELFRLKTFIGGPVLYMPWLMLFYFFSFRKYIWSDSGEITTGDASPVAPKKLRTWPIAALLIIIVLLGLAAGIHSWHLGGHIDTVNSLAFSPDGGLLASGSQDTTIKLWDTKSAKLLRTLTGHRGEVSALSFSKDGTLLASGAWASPARDYSVKIWDPTTGRLLRTLYDPAGGVYSLAFGHDDKLLAVGTQDDVIKLWEVGTGKLVNTLKTDESVGFVAFSPDDNTLVSGTREMISVWDLPTGARLRTIRGYNPIALNSAGEVLAIGVGKSKDRLEQLEGKPVVFDPLTGKELRALSGPRVYPNDHTFSRPLASPSPDWTTLAVAEPWPSTTIGLWNLDAGKKIRAFSRFVPLGSAIRFERMLFSPDGKYLAVGSNDRAPLVVWDTSTGRRRAFNGGWLKDLTPD